MESKVGSALSLRQRLVQFARGFRFSERRGDVDETVKSGLIDARLNTSRSRAPTSSTTTITRSECERECEVSRRV